MAAPTTTYGCIIFTLKKWGAQSTSKGARAAGLGQPAQAQFGGRPFLHVGPLTILHLDPFNCIILATSSSCPR
jgi:hypothetical protein